MTTPGGREHRAARWLTGGLAVWLLPVAILSASEPSAPSGSGIMPNTGVSIEDPLPVDTGSPDTKQAAPTQQPQGDPADKNDLTSAASSAGQADEGGQGDAVPHEPRMIPRGGSSVGGHMRRSTSDQSSTTHVTRAETPWYATGLGALSIVLAIMVLAYFAARRWLPSARTLRSDIMSVVGTTSLSPKHSVSLIRLGRRFVMVGVSPDRISPLCEVVDPDEVAALMAPPAPGDRPSDGFGDLLASRVSDFRDTSAHGAGDDVVVDQQADGARSSLMQLLSKVRSLQARS